MTEILRFRPDLILRCLIEREVHFVHVASLHDLIEMKRAAGRPKDRIELEILGALREELDRLP